MDKSEAKKSRSITAACEQIGELVNELVTLNPRVEQAYQALKAARLPDDVAVRIAQVVKRRALQSGLR